MPTSNAYDVIVVGAGAAGLFAAMRAGERGKRVLLLEKNTKPGVKILMSGGTRCNLTHAVDRRGLGDAFPKDQSRFLRAPLAAIGPEELVQLFHRNGLPTKVEATGKVFPASDRALDVQRTILAMFDRSRAELYLQASVDRIEKFEDQFIVHSNDGPYHAPKVILSSGGQSYPGCGTTGDGYVWAKQFGHKIVPPRPALVPLKTSDTWAHELSGLTLPNVEVRLVEPGNSKPLIRRTGSLLHTHVGLSGPVVMDISRVYTGLARAAGLQIECDLVPHMSEEQLLENLKTADGRRQVIGIVSEWVPRRLAEALFDEAHVPRERVVAEFSKVERREMVRYLKRCPYTPSGTLGFAKAEVTAGGVVLDEVDSRDMQSKLVPGLYLAGEILDIDGPIGGYNFQAAFSTGWLAGESV